MIWLLVAVAVFCLLAVPPLQDAWAYYRWERVKCRFNEGKQGFAYEYNGTKYYAARVDFWDRVNTQAVPTNRTGGENYEDLCYVSPGNPTRSVLTLNAHKRLDRAGQSLFLSGLVICVGIALSFLSNKRRREQLARPNA